jgi:hypothetical protein
MTTRIETEDVVEHELAARLRAWEVVVNDAALANDLEEAADTIERLREENARVVGILLARIQVRNDCIDVCAAEVTDCQCRDTLRAALTPSADDDK